MITGNNNYVHDKRTRDGTCVLFCVAPFFLQLITDNTFILSCAVSPIGANSPLNESSEELRMKRLRFSFFPPQDYASRDRFGITTVYLPRTKIKRTLSSTGKRPTTQIRAAAGKPGWPMQVERWRGGEAMYKFRRLRQETGKDVTGHVNWGEVSDTFFSLFLIPYLHRTLIWIFYDYLFA